MLHSIFHSVDHMLVEEVPSDEIAAEEMLESETIGEETVEGDDSITEQELPGDDDTVENTDSTNIPLPTVTYSLPYEFCHFNCDHLINDYSLTTTEKILL